MLATFAVCFSLGTYTSPVTAISVYGGTEYVGRADGAVERVGADLASAGILAKPAGRPVSFISASPYGLAWLRGPGGAIREKVAPGKPAEQTLTIDTGDSLYAVKIQPDSPIRRLAWLNGRVAVSYDIGTRFFDSRGREVTAASFIPGEAAQLAQSGSMWVREQDDRTELAVFSRPYSVRRDPRNQKAPLVSLFTAYQVGAWQWVKLGGFASNAFDAFPDGELLAGEDGKLAEGTHFLVLSDRVGLTQDGIVAREPESLVNAPVFEPNWETARVDGANVPGDPLWFGAAGEDAWWWNGTALTQQNRRSGKYCAYLPWAGTGEFTPHCFAASSRGLWVGSSRGLRLLDPVNPDEKQGFAGFIRMPFGDDAAKAPDPNIKKLTDAIFAWRFATADKAGDDGAVMVASVFSTLGIQVPQTIGGLRNAGNQVTDEIHFGDVIVGTNSAAIYLGSGTTVEVRGDRVQNGDVWAFPKAVVRRFF